MTVSEALAGIPLFAKLPVRDLKKIAAASRLRRCRRSDEVIREGDAGDFAYVILSGVLNASVRGNKGTPTMLSTMGAGEIFGEISVLDGQPRSATVIAITDADILPIEGRDFLRLVQTCSEFRMGVMALMAHRLRRQSLQSSIF